MLATNDKDWTIDDATFERVVALTYDATGILLGPQKRRMVSGRLRRRVLDAGLPSYGAYLDRVKGDAEERSRMLDSLTTNETYFFREPAHFELLEGFFSEARAPWTIWSAASSTGEEPYSVAISARAHMPRAHANKTRLLATDVSPSVLAHAKRGQYEGRPLSKVPQNWLATHFEDRGNGRYQVSEGVRRMVTFARLNLMGPWGMRGPFDLVLLRNVMIYFDEPTRRWLVERIAELLRPGGYLFIGHSETLGEATPTLERVQPAVYRRNDAPPSVGERPR
ncbi:MAG: protein-glutamate O-methyltransferase CheR [Myxococcota bacterium]